MKNVYEDRFQRTKLNLESESSSNVASSQKAEIISRGRASRRAKLIYLPEDIMGTRSSTRNLKGQTMIPAVDVFRENN